VKKRLWSGWLWQKIDSVRVAGEYSFGAACIGSPEGAAALQRQILRFWLRQNDELKQTKANTEILAAPE
jgi:hypothetical protein